MPDFAISGDPAVQAQLARLTTMSPGVDQLGLERITRLLDRLGNPEQRLPPAFHVAGTNGKGSTCAFLRSALEAAGYRVHVYTSPHLVRFNERIRIAGTLISDAALAALLDETLDAARSLDASFFEVTTAAAFLAFTRTPADACVIEVGLGGRLDATNVIPAPLVCGIAQLGIDHQAFLGDTIEGIAREKAGIAKPGAPLVTMAYPPDVAAAVAGVAAQASVQVLAQGYDWQVAATGDSLHYRDGAGALHLPLPALAGPHQPLNLGLATAMLRHQSRLSVEETALAQAARTAEWPARMQRLAAGPLTASLAPRTELWLDGGHNPAAAASIAAAIGARGRPAAMVLGMLANKDAAGFLTPFREVVTDIRTVPIAGHDHHTPAALAETARALGFAAHPSEAIAQALASLQQPVILITGSLYLAGQALEQNGQVHT